ncbi:hypothetical protein EG329_000679 [Mollisiaceae sp. DMI_Dod_QoI]|nr:hypothetical protein EG329_000679 [Helotiales sp. DMI_Dod_QoI]
MTRIAWYDDDLQNVTCIHPRYKNVPPSQTLFEHPAVVLDIFMEGNDKWAIISPCELVKISSNFHAKEAMGKIMLLFRPADWKKRPEIYDGLEDDEIIHLEESGGTFEKPSAFQYSMAWKVKFSMFIPMNKLLWSNRLQQQSYRMLMGKLGLRPAEWIETKQLVKEEVDPAYKKIGFPSDILLGPEPHKEAENDKRAVSDVDLEATFRETELKDDRGATTDIETGLQVVNLRIDRGLAALYIEVDMKAPDVGTEVRHRSILGAILMLRSQALELSKRPVPPKSRLPGDTIEL